MNAPWTEDTIQSVLAANRFRADDSPFLTLINAQGHEENLSYDALIRRAERWASAYAEDGIQPGDRVVVIFEHGIDLYAAYIGALLLGAVPAMFAHPSPKLSEAIYFETIQTLLESSGAVALATWEDLARRLEPVTKKVSTIRSIVTGTDSLKNSFPAFSLRADPDAPAFLQYSSGTTGLKKGVMISHRALIWQVRTYAEAIGANEKDTIVSWLPLYHDMGLIACFFLPLITRCKVVALSPFDWVKRPEMWLDAVSRHKGTLSWLPNFSYAFLARNTTRGGWDLSSLRGVVNCSEPVTQAAHAAFTERFAPNGFRASALAASYAMAETTFAVTSGGCGTPVRTLETDGRTIVSSGKVLPETTVRILDDAGQPLADGRTGEIEVSSPSLFTGYDGNPELGDQVLESGRYRTGDLGFLDDGDLFVTGRKRDLIIIGGKNIYPHDIEALAESIEGIVPGRTVALGDRDEIAGTEAMVVLAESNVPEADWPDLAAAVRSCIASATEVTPRDVRIVPPRWLRKSTSGKIARAANLERYTTLPLLAPLAPETPTSPVPHGASVLAQSTCANVRQIVEGLTNGTIDDDASLIREGRIDSFSVVNLILSLEQSFGIRIPEQVAGDPAALDSVEEITATVEALRGGEDIPESEIVFGPEDVPMTSEDPVGLSGKPAGFWTWYYRLVFRRKGIRYGKGLRVLGPILLRTDGDPRNISFGDGVTIMPWADLKVRENGAIRIGHGCAIDTTARLVAANNATIRLGDRAQIAFASIINAGEDVTIGRDTATAGHCTIIASEHRYDSPEPIMQQGYRHEPVLIGADVWLASGVLVTPGAKIGNGAVISANATVSGTIPPYALAAGAPARVIGSRLKEG
jgi:fatty-acyl-CoA synthase